MRARGAVPRVTAERARRPCDTAARGRRVGKREAAAAAR